MKRKKEIEIILEDLLRKVDRIVDNNLFSYDVKKIIKANREIVKLSKEIEKYLEELDALTD